ncbi:MFS transporter, partial [Dietzia sp.]|uniref:MFS transporter n=1 Tax=Dietzia sp. TaxID=1871616 RepID=UPI002FD94CC3
LTFVAIALFVPAPTALEPVSVADELSSLKQPQVLLTLAMGAVGFGGLFAIYSYIQWTLVEVSGVPREAMPGVLALYGVGMVIGGLIGGALADRNLDRTVVVGIAVIAAMLAVFYFATPNPVTAVIALFLVGTATSVVIPALQARLMQWAGRGQTLAAALNHSALNAANALGAWLGGAIIAAGWGYRAPAVVAVGLALLGFAIALPTVLFARRARRSHELVEHAVADD